MSFLFNDAGAVDSTEGDTKGRGLRLVCTAANLYPHFRHSQMPVPRRCTDIVSHFGHR